MQVLAGTCTTLPPNPRSLPSDPNLQETPGKEGGSAEGLCPSLRAAPGPGVRAWEVGGGKELVTLSGVPAGKQEEARLVELGPKLLGGETLWSPVCRAHRPGERWPSRTRAAQPPARAQASSVGLEVQH